MRQTMDIVRSWETEVIKRWLQKMFVKDGWIPVMFVNKFKKSGLGGIDYDYFIARLINYMSSPNKNNFPLGSSAGDSPFHIERAMRNRQSQYLSEEYERAINSKIEKAEEEKQKKRQELDIYNRKNEDYLKSLLSHRYNRHQEKQYMASEYEEMIQRRKIKEMEEKNNEINFEKELLGQPSWIRDMKQERDINKRKVESYSKELEMHVMAQEHRKSQELQMEREWRDRINEQAKLILQKQYQELQQRHKKKSQFQQRQNELLGVQSNPEQNFLGMSGSRVMEEIKMRKAQQEVYGKGLESQVQINEQRRRKEVEDHFNPGENYNPITNPIPIRYKNPNVLRMLSQR